MTELFKLMSDETRLRILLLLSKEELCVCQLTGIMELSQPKVSKHLTKLRHSGVVKDERRDKFVFYSLDQSNEALMDLVAFAQKHEGSVSFIEEDYKRLVQKDMYLTNCGTPIASLEV